MLGAIKRVISGEDVMNEGGDGSNPNLRNGRPSPSQGGAGTPHSQSLASPALVENDMNIDTSNMLNTYTPRSSLSDVSGYQDDAADATERTIPSRVFTREDSKVSSSDASNSSSVNRSSQTSSRDWGWFEDVHASEHANNANSNSKRKDGAEKSSSKQKKKSKGGSLVPTSSMEDANMRIRHVPVADLETEAAAMAVTAPTYVLEESLSSQKLWKYTAGQRPPQPVEERAFFEKMWTQNFARSQVEYQMPVEVLTATTPISLSPFADGNFNESSQPESTVAMESYSTEPALEAAMAETMKPYSYHHQTHLVGSGSEKSGLGGDFTILQKGDNVFGTTVSKSFARQSDKGGPIVGVDTVNISIASYRVVESKKHGKYAQFLVIYREGGIRDTICVWKRYSDFQQLSNTVTQAHEGCSAVLQNMSPLAMTEESDVEHLPNAITSWRLLKKRQRWYRCLDAGYLSLKVFLLERFLHDILFESTSPDLLRDFVGAAEAP